MAVIIRHGPAGSYKSSYAVWFELLPALREGRVVVTNVEGMKPLEDIEQLLGERFPISARLFRISSQTTKGKTLWQHWYNWVPLGAFVLIDEAQDIYTKTQGFNMVKNLYVGLDKFKADLPDNFVEFYQRVRDQFKPDSVYVDDIGEKIIDEDGSIIMPADFSESFQRHRKYNWDIVLCTPNIKAIADEIKSVSEIAIAHKSRDGMGFKRRTRLFEHDPRSTSIKPTKEDSVVTKKVPVSVHLLYQSTATGLTTKAGVTTSIFRRPKLWIALAAFTYGIYSVLSGLYGLNNARSDDSLSPEQKTESATASTESIKVGMAEKQADLVLDTPEADGLAGGDIRPSYANARANLRQLDKPVLDWPFEFERLYVSGVQQEHINNRVINTVVFESVDSAGDSHFLQSFVLERLGYDFEVLDHCLVMVRYRQVSQFLACRGKPVRRNNDTRMLRQLMANQAPGEVEGISLFGGA
ncbi:zonular occludens toxin domain-containing protein [Photobacterium ganghwense]|uniref:zonular occludens toxin domain-containing protein n=1 Tax=Photobacterium ganghwense TaxID=320778 RepID=UPI0039EEB7EE